MLRMRSAVALVALLGCCGWSEAFGGEADSLNRLATYLDGKVGSHVVLNCPLDFPQDDPIPYVLRWFKDVSVAGMGLHVWDRGRVICVNNNIMVPTECSRNY